jgi:hypothetical protein
MNHVNSKLLPTTIGRVHATTDRVHAAVGRVPITVVRRRGCLPWSIIHVSLLIAKPGTSDMLHKWIEHVRWTLT